MKTEDKKILENAKKRMKKQNDYIKQNFDRVSVVMEKGKKELIEKSGSSINGFINTAIDNELKKRGLLKD